MPASVQPAEQHKITGESANAWVIRPEEVLCDEGEVGVRVHHVVEVDDGGRDSLGLRARQTAVGAEGERVFILEAKSSELMRGHGFAQAHLSVRPEVP